MAGPEVEQRLAAILAPDVAGDTHLMAGDEPETITAMTDGRVIFRRQVETNGGQVVGWVVGD